MNPAPAASALEAVLAAHAAATSGAMLACSLASMTYYRRGPDDGPVEPFTVIKPLRGLDEGLEDKLRSLLEADRDGVLQVLFAVESESDPAHAAAVRVVSAFPARDARVIVTGPSGERMGKMHNLIEAYPHARHPVVVFSDSDVVTDRALLVETSSVFRRGADAACAMPDASGGRTWTDALIGLLFNHYFCVPGALGYRLGLFCPFAGAWMAFHKETIERIGGLERYATRAADDFSMGFATLLIGAKAVLLRRQIRLFERGGTFAETARHMVKWLKIGRVSAPPLYIALPFLNGMLSACIVCGLHASRTGGLGWTAALLGFVAMLRSASAWALDGTVAAERFPLWAYAAIPVLDVAGMTTWFWAWGSNRIEWRGRRYRLRYGGLIEPIRPTE